MKYWLQLKSRAGNWYDALGSDNLEVVKDHGEWLIKNTSTTHARVVERVDNPIWEMPEYFEAENQIIRDEINKEYPRRR